MRTVASGVYLETKYPGVHLGAVAQAGKLLLIDSPIRVEDDREWLAQLSEKGRPRYLVVLDHHPDRVLGARGLDLPIVAHDETRLVMSAWPDTFKGATRPIGAEADRLKRITGVSKAVPDLTFSETLVLHLDRREVHLWHRPGPTGGSIWVVLPDVKVAFIGDTVWLDEPPYVGDADIDRWVMNLAELGRPPLRSFSLVSARDGLVERKDVGRMSDWLERTGDRLRKLGARGEGPEAAMSLAPGLMRSFKVTGGRREQGVLRLHAGLERLYARAYAEED